MNNPSPGSEKKWATVDWYWLAALLGIVSLTWCGAYNRWAPEAWQTPVTYNGDALAQMAIAKVFGSGEVMPIVTKTVASLGAPFGANWNDYPLTEEGIFVGCGLMVRLFGVFLGSNLAVLSGHLLSATSFYLVCRALSVERTWAASGAFLFSMSHFACTRSLSHLVIGFYWHVPLGLLVVWWCIRSEPVLGDRKRILMCVVVAILHGIQNVYYSAIFLQFLFLASFICLVRRYNWSRVVFPLLLASVLLATLVLMNADTLYYRFAHGPNPQAVVREYSGLERFALKPIELLVPFPHRIDSVQDWALRSYFWKTTLLGEIGSPYLGIVGIGALGLLAWSTVRALVSRPVGTVPWQFGFALWVLLFSIVGGINGMLGSFGVVLFRGTNRYSIVILALALLYLVQQLSRATQHWRPFVVLSLGIVVSLIGFLDQVPAPPRSREIAKVREQVSTDRGFVATLEAKLPPRAMVFQLPVVDFPEAPPVREMESYAHLKPYLYSRSLRFSYGSVKGRPRERWQREAVQLGAADLPRTLENYGFAAVMLNKRAYEDRGASLVATFQATGRARVVAESREMIGLTLSPSSRPLMPPVFEAAWYDLEGDQRKNWRWSSGNADVVLESAQSKPVLVHLTFRLASLEPREVDIYFGDLAVYKARLTGSDETTSPIDLNLTLPPGPSRLHFQTDKPAEIASTTDPRKLAFKLIDFRIAD